ncbi:uncharacterized protein LOC143445976 [Clavelina lepadiformis]|uniref:uncharacterized protein LOC143445976 n=1 Tax=Clavelina lepadiformis TaxID=159417 RepID=UPI004040EC92
MSSSALPPLGNLPSWSRVSTLDRSRYPKPFLRDRLQTLPPTGSSLVPLIDHHGDAGQTSTPMDIQFLNDLSPAEQQKLLYYNKNIKFLQQQHADTLQKLHEEVDRLKQENKDLQFKFIMGKNINPDQGQRSFSAVDSSSVSNDAASGDLQSILLQEEVKDLRLALKNAQGRNNLLQHALQMHRKRSGKGKSSVSSNNISPEDEDHSEDTSPFDQTPTATEPSYLSSTEATEHTLPFGATLDPLRIQDSPGVEPRSPSVPECEVIIKYLHRLSARQQEENHLLKADLRDLLYSTKSAISRRTSSKTINTNARSEEVMKLPKVSLKQNLSHQHTVAGTSTTERVTLPALKHSMNTNVAIRKKRQQAVQKTRTKREIPHHL